MFVTAWVFEAHHCPTLLNEIKKTKLKIYTEPQDGINILLPAVGFSSPLSVVIFCRNRPPDTTRPEKSLHFLVKSPDTNLHFLVSPEIALHLITG